MKKFLTACSLVLLISSGTYAQQFSLYHSNTLIDAFNNPSHELFKDTCKKWASNLFIPAFSFDATFKGQANPLVLGIIRSRALDFSKMENGRKEFNELDINTDLNVFMMRFRLSKRRRDEVSFGFQLRSNTQFAVKNEFFNILRGNNAFAGERLNGFLDMDTYTTNYTSASLGYRSKITNKLSGGFRYSLLNGLANQSLKIDDSYLFTEENGEYIEMAVKGTYYSSVKTLNIRDISTATDTKYDVKVNNNAASDLIKDFITLQNKGFAFSMGFDYQFTDKLIATASLKDMGAIYWNRKNSIRYILNKTLRFDGFPVTDTAAQDSILNKLGSFVVDSIKGGYTTYLPARLELSAQYKVTNWYRPAIIISKEIGNSSVDFTLLNDLVLLNRLHFIIVTGVSTNKFFSVGGQLLLNTKWLDWYIGSERLLNTYTVANYNNYYMPLAADVTMGMAFKFGHCPKPKKEETPKDTDLDGLADALDLCPTVAGPRENRGCPYTDTDSDGVLDSLDKCPTVSGPIENQGCPYSDTDSDGILDKDDLCPTAAGPLENKGCPYSDTDNDGVLDTLDMCPTLAGPIGNNGCPYPDTDGDSVIDISDKCPTIPGTVANNGCPEEPKRVELTKAEQEVINKVFKNLTFETGKAVIKPTSYPALDGLLALLNKKPEFKVLIEGHTDNTGSESLNNKLSQERAGAVKKYLIQKGIEDARIISVGYGPSRPVADNSTPEGRAKNRRVEFTIIE